MASELELRWLKAAELKGAAKHFAQFCKEDIQQQAGREDFDLNVYQDAAKLILSKLDRSLTLEKLSKRIAEELEDLAEPEDAGSQEDLSQGRLNNTVDSINTQGARVSEESSNAD